MSEKIVFDPTKHLLDFIIYDYNDYIVSKHNRFICEVLDRLSKGVFQKVLLNVPPQYGKSHVAHRFSSKYFMENPHHSIIYTSASDSLVNKASRNAQTAVKLSGDLFNVSISKHKSSTRTWQLDGYEGIYNAVPLRGQIVGETAHLLIMDDMLKNHVEAFSKKIKDGVWDFWDSTLRTRLAPNYKILLINTRWAKDDLPGRIIEKEPDGWVVINLPALANENDPLERKPGEPLWEWKHTKEELLDIKSKTSKYFWDSIWQGSPTSLDGEFQSEWLIFYKEGVDYIPGKHYKHEKIIKTISAKDPATGKKKKGLAYPVIITADITETKKIIVRDIWRKRQPIPDQLRQIIKVHEEYNANPFLIEEVQLQIAYRQILNETSYSIPFWPVHPHSNKLLRIDAIAPDFKNGKIIISEHMRDFIDEYLDFPNGDSLDILDALEMIVSYVRNHMKDILFDFKQIMDLNTIKKEPFMEF